MGIVKLVKAGVEERLDTWMSALTGLGTPMRDKLQSIVFAASGGLSDETLESLYNSDDMAATACNLVPDEMLRQGFDLQLDDAEDSTTDSSEIVSVLHGLLDELGAREKFTEAMTWANVFKGSAILVGARDGQLMDQPLNEDSIEVIDGLTVFDSRVLKVERYYDETHKKWGEPELYKLQMLNQGRSDSFLYIHESRLIVFQGLRATRQYRLNNGGWGHSLLERIYQPLKQFQSVWAGVAHVMQDAHQAVWKIDGLIDMIASGDKETMMTRMEMVERGRSVVRAIVLDADREEFERQSTNLGGIEGILDKFMLRLSAAARAPATILMGQSPAGLNATGESDIRWFYDTVKSKQTNDLKPKMERLVYLLMRSKQGPTNGVELDNWSVTFPPLWQMSPIEEAGLRKMVAETDEKYVAMQAVLPEEVTLSRFRAEGYSTEWLVDLELRKKALEIESERMLEPPKEPPPPPPPVPLPPGTPPPGTPAEDEKEAA